MSYLDEHKDEIFKKYPKEKLIKEIDSFINGDGRLRSLLEHFFEEEIYKCCGKKSKISPIEVLQNDELIKKVIDYTKSKPKFFKGSNEVANIKCAFRNSFSWVRKVSNFPPKEAKKIYERYENNFKKPLNILDTSCGFGSRMSACLLFGNNYFGIDPNKSLQKNYMNWQNFIMTMDI